jgi:ABC-type nitrate/sulfonate/bicarbonate transport system substrate-binding protein
MTVPAQPAEVKVALDWTPNTNHIGIYVAQELGYYKDQGLTVKLLPYASTSPERLVSSGEAQFGFSYSNGIAFARASEIASDVAPPARALSLRAAMAEAKVAKGEKAEGGGKAEGGR